MASLTKSLFALLLALFILSSSSAMQDMSIINYDKTHNIDITTTTSPSPARTHKELQSLYESWLVKNHKNYNALGEKERRFEIFKDNLRFIDENNNNNSVSRTYKLGLTRFADLTNEEYRAKFLGVKIMEGKRKVNFSAKSERYVFKDGDELPEAVDWRQKGAVAPVKDQGQCGEW